MQVEIMNHKWEVVLKDEMNMNSFGEDTLGLTQFPSRKISILNTLVGEQLEQVVTHEIVHAMLDECGCSTIENYGVEFICNFISNNIRVISDLSHKVIESIKWSAK